MTDRQRYKSIYWCWKAIKQRVLNPKCAAYHNYGGRGIGMCDEWLEFEPFLAWSLASGWQKGLELDRIDNDGDYCPENCRWTTSRANTNNRRLTILFTIDGVTRPLTEWADISGIPQRTIGYWRYTHGDEYAKERIREAIEHGYLRKNYSRNHTKRIRHVESGMEFPSMAQAAKEFGLNRNSLAVRMCKFGGRTKVGHFAYV